MPSRALLIIPTYNEAGNITHLISEILEQGTGLDILIIDDSSPDGTAALAERLAERAPITVIRREGKLGIGSAHKRGFQYALDRGYEWALTMDADFSHSPRYLRDLLEASRCADVAVGSRYIPGGGLFGWGAFRLLLTHTAHWLTTHVLRVPYDCTGGFRLYHADVLRAIDFQRIRSEGYAFLIEMIFQVSRSGFQVREVPIVINSRHKGVSKISRYEIFKAVKTLLRLSFSYHPPAVRPAVPRARVEMPV